MNDQFDPDDLVIHWIGDIPVADLAPHVDPKLTIGEWRVLDDVMALFKVIAHRLCSLRGRAISGSLIPLVNRTLSQMAVVELPTKQRSLVLASARGKQDGIEPSSELSTDDQSSGAKDDVSAALAGAIHTAESVLRGVASGNYVSAEQFISAVGASPDPELTTSALKLAGSGSTVQGTGVSYTPGDFQKFPEILETSGIFRMRFSKFGSVGIHEVMATFEWLHVEGQATNLGIGELLKGKQRLPVYFASSKDALVFRIGAAAGLVLDADVSITISTFARSVERFTLFNLVDREESLKQLDLVVMQLRLPLDDLVEDQDGRDVSN